MKECPLCGVCVDDAERECGFDGEALVRRYPGPTTVGEAYVLKRRLGHGAMGDVYEAEHRHLGRRVALKILRSGLADAERRVRFEHEARALGALQHPNVVDVSDFGVDTRGLPYLVMEHLQGRTLREELARRGGPVPLSEALPWLVDLARGLDAAHAAGILHRDLKPENVFLTADGVAKLLDFGLVKRVDGDESASPGPATEGSGTLTEDGTTVGTRAYLAPEVATGHAASRASDLYALGLVAFEMLTARRPFVGTGIDLLHEIVETPAPRPSEVEPALPLELDAPLLRALHKSPSRRPPSAGAFVEGLHAASSRALRELEAVRLDAARRAAAPRYLRVAVLAALLTGAVSAALLDTSPLKALEDRITNRRFALAARRPADPRLLVVALDEASLAADPTPLGAQADVFADRLSRLFDAGAAGVAVDATLPESFSRSEAFSRFVLSHRSRLTLAANSEGGRVIGPECVAGLTASALGTDGAAALFGFVNVEEGPDGVAARAPRVLVDLSGSRRDGFARHAARWLGVTDTATEPVILDYAVDQDTLERVSWKDVPGLLAREPARVRDRLVLVGGTFLGSGDDRFRLPSFSNGSKVPGVILQAIVVNTLLRGAPLREPLPSAGIAAEASLAGLVVWGILRSRRAWGPLLGAALVLALAFVSSVASGFVLPVAGLLASVLLASLLGFSLRAVLGEAASGPVS